MVSGVELQGAPKDVGALLELHKGPGPEDDSTATFI